MNTRLIAIIGLGLIGGSLGMALKKALGPETEVLGFARKQETADAAIKLGAVDRTTPQLSEAVRDSQIIIIATPIMAIREVFQDISDYLAEGAIVTDVGSTKTAVVEWAGQYLPRRVTFVGGHPMCGKETAGLAEASGDLFIDSIYCLTPNTNANSEVIATLVGLVQSIGAKPLILNAKHHDDLVAGISHLPLILSLALSLATGKSPLWPEMSKLAATGYFDMTRLAAGSPDLSYGICSTNQAAILEWIDRCIDELERLRSLMATDNNEQLREALKQARQIRQQWIGSEGYRFKKTKE